jgi:hypothetical protein
VHVARGEAASITAWKRGPAPVMPLTWSIDDPSKLPTQAATVTALE